MKLFILTYDSHDTSTVISVHDTNLKAVRKSKKLNREHPDTYPETLCRGFCIEERELNK